jgi:hypothetical protein
MDLNPALLSKINWTQVVSFGAMALTVFGLDLPPETQVAIVAVITGLTNVITIVWRTWFTGSSTA